MKRIALTLTMFVATSAAANTNSINEVLAAYLEDEVRGWATDAVIIDAIRAQNAVTGDYSQDRIDALDKSWRASVDVPETEIIANVVDNDASDYLRDQVSASLGVVSEVFVMDARGLNVAASQPTSDFWQGDEDKYIKTYLEGGDAVHFSDVEYDESTQRYQAQMSFTVTDPDTGESIGAVTVGVDASLF